MSVILILADATKADVPRIAIVQAMRVAILVAILPPLITLTVGEHPPVSLPERALVGPVDLLLLVLAGFVGMAILKAMRFPAVAMSGPMIASAILHGTDVVSSVAPQPVLIVSFVILGAVIGVRFSGLSWSGLRAGIADALLVFVIGFTVALVTAILATWWLGISFAQTILAFAPGAFEVMVVLAFLLGADAAYVGAHHAVRFIALAMLAPILFRRRPAEGEPEGDRAARDP